MFPQFQDKTVQTLRWIFYELAGKVVEHSRKLYLKINVATMCEIVSIRKLSILGGVKADKRGDIVF